MFTEDGQNQIKEDLKKAGLLIDSIKEVAISKSVSLIEDKGDGQTGFMTNNLNKLSVYEGTKKYITDPKNEKNVAILQNQNATPAQKKEALTSLHTKIADEMGITPAEVKVILDKQYKGFTSEQTNKVYIADNLHKTNSDLANTIGNETSDVADLTRDKDVIKTENYKTNRDEYSTKIGNLTEELLNEQYSTLTGSSLKSVINNKVGTNLNKPNELDTTVINNTREFATLDKAKGAHRQLNKNEISFLTNKNTIEEFAKIKYKTDTPNTDQLQGAKHALAQEGLRGVDAIWNTVLGKHDKEAQEFLSEKTDGLTFTNTRGEKQELFSAKNGDFYDPSRYAKESVETGTDIYKVAQENSIDIINNPSLVRERVVKKIADEVVNIPKKASDYIDEKSKESFSSVLTEKIVGGYKDLAEKIVNGAETAIGMNDTSKETFSNIYGKSISENIDKLSTDLAIGATVGGAIILPKKFNKKEKSTEENTFYTNKEKSNTALHEKINTNTEQQNIEKEIGFQTQKVVLGKKLNEEGQKAHNEGSNSKYTYQKEFNDKDFVKEGILPGNQKEGTISRLHTKELEPQGEYLAITKQIEKAKSKNELKQNYSLPPSSTIKYTTDYKGLNDKKVILGPVGKNDFGEGSSNTQIVVKVKDDKKLESDEFYEDTTRETKE